jgi:uncharacterized membrane protein (UPF0127 family)
VRRPRAIIAAAAALVVAAIVLVVVGLAQGEGGDAAKPLAGPIASALAGDRPAVSPFDGWREARLAIGTRCLRLVVARTMQERTTGLMGRRDLGPYDGMIFVTQRDTTDAFTMAGTYLPLDLGLYARSGQLLERDALVPCPTSVGGCPITLPAKAYRMGVEMQRGSMPSGAVAGCGS